MRSSWRVSVERTQCLPAFCAMRRNSSNNAVEELGLKPGDEALAVIKATSVMVGIDD